MSCRRGLWSLLAIGAATIVAVACNNDGDSSPQGGGENIGGEGGDRSGNSDARAGASASAPGDAGAISASDGGSAAHPNAGGDSSAGTRPDGGAGGEPGGPGGAGGRASEADDSAAVAYRNDVGHSATLGHAIEPSLSRRWFKSFKSAVSYPLIVGPRVFVSTLGVEGKPVVLAYDRETGAELWSSKSLATKDGLKAHLAYDRGQIFAADDEGYIMAVNAETGSIGWNVRLQPIYAFATIPVAVDGVVFLTGATTDEKGNLFALSERDGSVLYRGAAQGAGHVTFGASRIFTSGGCNETKATDPLTGKELWHYKEDCVGGGGAHTLFDHGRLFVSSGDATVALDAATGKPVAKVEGMTSLVTVDADVALFSLPRQRGGEIRAFNLASGAEAWSVRLDNTPVLPLLLSGDYAYVATRPPFGETRLQAVNLRERSVVWTSTEPAAPRDTSFVPSGTEPTQGLAAAQGSIAVAFERALAIFASP